MRHVTCRLSAPLLVPWMLGCMPTLHTARIDPGFRLDAGVTVLADQPRERTQDSPAPQPTDYAFYVAPVYGFSDRVEIGLPIGAYRGNGLRGTSRYPAKSVRMILPYAKFAMLDRASRHHAALLLQATFFVPAIAGFRYGYDFGTWEPHVGVSAILSGGPGGDDIVESRYQQKAQRLLLLSGGASWNVRGQPVLEMGLLHNSYDESTAWVGSVEQFRRRSFVDAYVALRLSLTDPPLRPR